MSIDSKKTHWAILEFLRQQGFNIQEHTGAPGHTVNGVPMCWDAIDFIYRECLKRITR